MRFEKNLTEVAAGGALAPVKTLAAAVQPIGTGNLETFNIGIPAATAGVEAGVANGIAVTRVVTESAGTVIPSARRAGPGGNPVSANP